MSSVPALNRRIVPSHDSTVEQNPPSLWWSGYRILNPSINFTVSLWANVSSIDGVAPQWTFTTKVNYLNIPFTLPVATAYLWQVTRVNISSGTSIPSAARSFYLSPTAVPFVVPATVIEDTKNSAHPRLLMKGAARDTWLASSVGTSFKTRMQNLVKPWINGFFGAALPAAPTMLLTDYASSTARDTAAMNDYNNFVKPLVSSISGLMYSAWYEPANTTVLTELKRRVLLLASANPNGTTSHVGQDQANRAILLCLTEAYDLISASFNIGERDTLLGVIVNRGTQIYNAYGQLQGLLTYPHDSHGANTLGFMAMVAAGMLGVVPQADLWAVAIPMNFNMYNSWSGEDGGFSNGFGYAYWSAYNGVRCDVFEWATGVKMINKQNIFEWPKQFVYFGPYAATRGGLGFGDDGEKDMFSGALPVVCNNLISRVVQAHPDRYEAELFNNYCSQMPRFKNNLDFRYDGAIWSADFKNVTTLTKDYPKSVHLKTAGWAAFHSSMTDYNRTALFFRASKYGSYNHNNADQLSFTMVHQDQPVFIASGHYDSYMSPHHKNWRKTTRAQSGGITMDGGMGQAFESMEGTGRITQYGTTDTYDFVTGDAVLAYNAGLESNSSLRLTRAIRSLVYLRERNQFLIFDRFDTVSPRTFEWNIHAYENFTQVSPSVIKSTRKGVSACVNMLHSSTAVTFWQTDQFPPNAPVSLPNQAHGQFKFNANSTTAAFVVLIDPDCTGNVPQVTQGANGDWSFNVGQTSITFNGDELVGPPIVTPASSGNPNGNNGSPSSQSISPSESVSTANSTTALLIVLMGVVVAILI
jgi:hypothetical protein